MSTLPRPKRQGMLASLGLHSMGRKNSSNMLAGINNKDEKKTTKTQRKAGKLVGRHVDDEGNESGMGDENDAGFVVVQEEKQSLPPSNHPTSTTPSPTSNLEEPARNPNHDTLRRPVGVRNIPTGSNDPRTGKRNVTLPISYERIPPSSPSKSDPEPTSPQTRPLSLIRTPTSIPALGLGRPRSAFFIPSSERDTVLQGTSIPSPGKNKRNLTAPVDLESGLVKRRSMLWDSRKATGSGIPALAGSESKRTTARQGDEMTVGGKGLGLRHKRSVSAIVSLGNGNENGAGPGARTNVGIANTHGQVDKQEREQPKTIGTGMSLRPRTLKDPVVPLEIGAGVPGSKRQTQMSKRSSTPVMHVALDHVSDVRLSKRASQMTLLQSRSQSQAKSKVIAPTLEPARRSARLGHEKEPSTEDEADGSVMLKTIKRRSMMPLSFVQASESQEILASTSNDGDLGDVETNRQSTLDKLMGNESKKVEERGSLTASTASTRGRATGTGASTTIARTGGQKVTTTPARGQPVARREATPTATKTLGKAQPSASLLTKAGSSLSTSTRTRTAVNAVQIQDAVKNPKLITTPDPTDRRDPIRAIRSGRDPLDKVALDVGGVTPTNPSPAASSICQTPRSKMLSSPALKPGSRTSISPSRKDPLTRLRGTPASRESARSRKLSNNSDIDVRLEQARRTWMGGLSRRDLGAEGDSPLTGRMSELNVDGSLRSSRGKKVVGRTSNGAIGPKAADVFGVDKGTSAKIAALELQVKGLQKTLERERAEREQSTFQTHQRHSMQEMLVAVVRSCEQELELLERRRAEKERMVDAFDRSVGLAISNL